MNTTHTYRIPHLEQSPAQARLGRRLPGRHAALLRRHRTEFWHRRKLERLAFRLGLSPSLLMLTLLYCRERAFA